MATQNLFICIGASAGTIIGHFLYNFISAYIRKKSKQKESK